jgi:ribonuclease D
VPIALATGSELSALGDRARVAGSFGIDTEFIGEGRYRTLLCLIQVVVSDPAGTDVLVLDPLDPGLDLAPLGAMLEDPAIEVVMHAGRQDVALLRRHLGREVRSLFDTQVAAGFAGLSAQAGYDTLLRELLDVRLHKSASYTRWDKRPLTEEQIGYAREDVLHLLELAAELRRRLDASGRLEWAREECRPLEQSSDERDLDSIFARLPRINSLKPAARAIARELVEWREDVAARQDRPVSTVLNDSALVELAKRRPASFAELESIRGVNPGSLRRRGEELLAAIERGRERPPIPAERAQHDAASPLDAPLIALAEALVRGRASEAGMAYELIAARSDLAQIVASTRTGHDEADVRTLRGWRRELVGDELLELLAGRRALAVGTDWRLSITDAAARAGR